MAWGRAVSTAARPRLPHSWGGPRQSLAAGRISRQAKGETDEGRTRYGPRRGVGGTAGSAPTRGRAPAETPEPGKKVSVGGFPPSPPPPGRLPALPVLSRPAPPRAGCATSSGDVSQRRHIGKAQPPPPPPSLPRSSGCLGARDRRREELFLRFAGAWPARFAPTRLPMTAPRPAADGRRPGAGI